MDNTNHSLIGLSIIRPSTLRLISEIIETRSVHFLFFNELFLGSSLESIKLPITLPIHIYIKLEFLDGWADIILTQKYNKIMEKEHQITIYTIIIILIISGMVYSLILNLH